jgi:hypothetical protein
MSAQLSLFLSLDEVTAVATTPGPTPSHAATDGCGRLLKALVREGLPEDLWTVAASLVLELDSQAAEAR